MTIPVYFSRDPGAANVLVALFEIIREASGPERVPAGLRAFLTEMQAAGTAKVYAKDYATAVWQRAGIDVSPWPGEDIALADDPALLVTGTTDIDDDTERLLWSAARRRGIPSHAFLDHPANLVQRFIARDNTKHRPDWVYVPDTSYEEPLLAAGFTRREIRLAGTLHLDRIRKIARHSDAAPLRRHWGGGHRNVILFASECTSEMRAAGRSTGHDEHLALDTLLASIRTGTLLAGRTFTNDGTIVVIRPHPRDEPGKFTDRVSSAGSGPMIVVSADGIPEEAILAADVVAGIDSQLLHEATALGRPVCRLLPLMESTAPRDRSV